MHTGASAALPIRALTEKIRRLQFCTSGFRLKQAMDITLRTNHINARRCFAVPANTRLRLLRLFGRQLPIGTGHTIPLKATDTCRHNHDRTAQKVTRHVLLVGRRRGSRMRIEPVIVDGFLLLDASINLTLWLEGDLKALHSARIDPNKLEFR